MTFEEFLEWYGDVRAEWVNGEVEFLSPVSDTHQELSGFLFVLISLFVEAYGLGRVFDQTFVMKLGPALPGREPDMMFIASANLGRIRKTFLNGPADLVVEIVSPESQRRDRETKLQEYERGGVGEYWLVDPLRTEATFYQLQTDGRFTAALPDSAGIYNSAVLSGLWLDINWLWQRPLPGKFDVLRQWGII